MSYIQYNNVKGFGENQERIEVLDNINLSMEKGEFLAIVGFSGSGKSTLMSLLSGLQKPDSGSVLFDEKPISGPGPTWRRLPKLLSTSLVDRLWQCSPRSIKFSGIGIKRKNTNTYSNTLIW